MGCACLVADAWRRGDVAGALALIDRLAAGPAGAASDTFLADERKALVVQQALALLAAGDRAAARGISWGCAYRPGLAAPGGLCEPFRPLADRCKCG